MNGYGLPPPAAEPGLSDGSVMSPHTVPTVGDAVGGRASHVRAVYGVAGYRVRGLTKCVRTPLAAPPLSRSRTISGGSTNSRPVGGRYLSHMPPAG